MGLMMFFICFHEINLQSDTIKPKTEKHSKRKKRLKPTRRYVFIHWRKADKRGNFFFLIIQTIILILFW